MRFEYKIIPAPTRAAKVRGLKSQPDRFAHTLSEALNALAAEGWEYLRADTLPCEERKGLRGAATVFHTMLVLRRPVLAQQGEDVGAAPETPVMRPLRADPPLAASRPAVQQPDPAPAADPAPDQPDTPPDPDAAPSAPRG